jgi:hypoxanthine-guanine phosphoribosyltransferase
MIKKIHRFNNKPKASKTNKKNVIMNLQILKKILKIINQIQTQTKNKNIVQTVKVIIVMEVLQDTINFLEELINFMKYLRINNFKILFLMSF